MKRIPLLIALLSVLLSCQKEGSAEIECFIDGQVIPYDGGSVVARIVSNTEWEADWDNKSEVTVEPASGRGDTYVTVSSTFNDRDFTRAERILFKAKRGESTASAVFVVTRGAKPFLKCSEKTKSAPAEETSVYFYVNSNSAWKIISMSCDGEAWEGTVVPDSKEWNGVNVRVDIPENTTGAGRKYEVKLVLDDYPDVSITLTVNQTA